MRTIRKLLHGCVNLFTQGSFLREWWTSEASLMSSLPISRDTTNVTSSRESEDGHTLCASQEYPTMNQSGQAVAPVSRSVTQREVAEEGCQARSICGPTCTACCLRAALLTSLGNKSRPLSIGWMLSGLKWKKQTTPSGRSLFRLTLSAQTIKENGFILRATPTTMANHDAPSMQKHRGCRGLVVTPQNWCSRMGFPPQWLIAASAMRSFRKSPRSSSARITMSDPLF